MPEPIHPDSVLPARREVVALGEDRAELALPLCGEPGVTLVCPTGTDHHVLRKAAWRLPALAGFGVLRARDLAGAVALVAERGLGEAWLAGWSFGADEVLRHADLPVDGAVLVSPSLRDVDDATLARWADRPVVVLVAELDDHLRPEEARARFASLPHAEVVVVDWARHDWEGDAERVLDELVRRVDPAAVVPLPTEWDGPMDPRGDLPIPRPRTEG